MKARNVMLAALFVALMGIGIWWVMRPSEIAPEKAAQAPVPAKAVAPPAAQVQMPKAAVVAPSSSLPAAATPEKVSDTPQLYVNPDGVTDVGTVQLTIGVPVTIYCNNGTKCTLTAISLPYLPQGSDKFAIVNMSEDPETGKTMTETGAAINGKQTRFMTIKGDLKLTPILKPSE